MADSRYIETPSGPLHVRVSSGQGDRMVLAVHGLGGSARNWDAIAAHLGGTVVAVDLPGFGLSPPRRGDQIDVQVKAVCEIIDHLPDQPLTLIGNSMGGLVAQHVALAVPRRLRRLVLVAPATPLPPGTLPSDPAMAARLIAQSLPVLGPAINRRMQRTMSPRALVESTLGMVTARRASIAPDILENAVEIAELRRSMPWASDVFADSAAAVRARIIRRSTFVETIEMISVPTLLMWGSEDRLVSPSSMSWLASLRPDWDTFVLEGIGHIPMMEAPATSADAITSWETHARDPGGRGFSRTPG